MRSLLHRWGFQGGERYLPLTLKMALRNVFRNRRRSALSLSAVSFGLVSLIFLRAFIYGAQSQMVTNVTTTLTGDLQILPQSQENIYNTNGAIEDPESIRTLLKKDQRLLGFVDEVLGGGMVASESESMATFLVGVDSQEEEALGMHLHIVQGRQLDANDPNGVLLGDPMMDVMHLKLGDEVIVTAQDYYGSIAAKKFHVIGTFVTGNDQIDNSDVILQKSIMKDLLSFDHRTSRFIVRIKPGYDAADVANDLKAQISNSAVTALTWEELVPMIGQLIQFQNSMLFIVVSIVFAIVAAGILNTFLMAVVERVREFGLMTALGTHSRQVVALIVMESLVLTFIGVGIGIMIGWGLCLYFGKTGIDLTRFVSTFANLLVGSHIYPRMDGEATALIVGFLFFSNAMAALYPAWKASRLDPIVAMRQVG